MRDQSTVKAYSLRVPKKLGEKAVRLAASLGLLNRDLKVRPDNGHLRVPLNRKPRPSQLRELDEALHQYDILPDQFLRCIKPTRNALEIAGDTLPPHLLASFPRAIDFVGNVAIVEVPPELEEHKRLVGEAILKAHKHVRTVLAKSSPVKGVCRLREYEVIAGSPNTETVHKEQGCRYYLDLRKVYFSPRLSHEHSRVASQVRENETVVDMFAGVGPFSVLIAKTHGNVKVYAVDVNPDAVRYLEKNAIANGVLGKVIPILGDARHIAHSRLHGTADRVIMNHPEEAAEYLGAACEAMKSSGGVIHYYEFAGDSHSSEIIKKNLTGDLNGEGRNVERFLSVRTVREVAPFRWQVAVDIQIR